MYDGRGMNIMKDLNLLIWLTQLGLSVAMPLGGFTLLGLWLRQRFELGVWVVLVGCAVGLITAIDGLRYSLRMMAQMEKKKDDAPPPVSFNDHE